MPRLHGFSSTARRMALMALAVLLLAQLARASEEIVTCSSKEECCQMCGDDSPRCARGPCHMGFLTASFFSYSLPTHITNAWDVICSFYSMVPYLIVIVLVVDVVLLHRTWLRVLGIVFIIVATIINTIIIVKALGACDECRRPCGSCIGVYGMPSGHATNAIGFCVWSLLETWRGVGSAWTTQKKAVISVALLLLFVPVPYSRVYLGDHTSLQVTIGSADGIVLAVLFFLLARFVLARHLDGATQWIERRLCGLRVKNDYSPAKNSTSSPQLVTMLIDSSGAGSSDDTEQEQQQQQQQA